MSKEDCERCCDGYYDAIARVEIKAYKAGQAHTVKRVLEILDKYWNVTFDEAIEEIKKLGAQDEL